MLGFCLYLFLNDFYFDEMHIISTDYQLRPGLTLAQVIRDILLTYFVYSSISGLVLGVMCVVALPANTLTNTLRWSEQRTKSAVQLAIVCWMMINAGVLIAGVKYVVHMAQRLGN